MARAFGATSGLERLGALTTVGLVVLPVAVAGLLTWSLSAPVDHLDRVTAAIVNDDKPVTIGGKTVPVGRQLAAGLIAGSSSASSAAGAGSVGEGVGSDVTWVLTNHDDARDGLAGGRYVAVMTIPQEFSANATSSSGPAADALHADVNLETSPAAALLDPALTTAVTQSAVRVLNAQLEAQYLTQLYQGFSTINAQLAQSAAGAASLQTGATSLASGASQLASGAGSLSSGLQGLDSGAASLSAGLGTLDKSVQPLPGAASQVAKGSTAVASAIAAESSAVSAATAQVAAVVAEVCVSSGPVCDRATAALARLQSASRQLAQLDAAAAAVAAGSRSLASAMPPLVAGVGQAASGSAQVAAGASQASAGGSQVAAASSQVASGAAQVQAGSTQLADGLTQGAAQVPTYTSDDIDVLSTVAAEPVGIDRSGPAAGLSSVPLFAVVALWLAAVVVAWVRAAVPAGGLLAAEPTGALARRALLPGAAIGAVQGLVTGAVVGRAVSADVAAQLWFVVGCALAGAVFVVVNQGLAAVLGGVGRFLAVLGGVAALAVGLTSAVPGPVRSFASLLPTAPGVDLLRGALGGDLGTAWGAALLLVVLGVLASLLVLAGVGARRRVRARDLAGPDVGRPPVPVAAGVTDGLPS